MKYKFKDARKTLSPYFWWTMIWLIILHCSVITIINNIMLSDSVGDKITIHGRAIIYLISFMVSYTIGFIIVGKTKAIYLTSKGILIDPIDSYMPSSINAGLLAFAIATGNSLSGVSSHSQIAFFAAVMTGLIPAIVIGSAIEGFELIPSGDNINTAIKKIGNGKIPEPKKKKEKIKKVKETEVKHAGEHNGRIRDLRTLYTELPVDVGNRKVVLDTAELINVFKEKIDVSVQYYTCVPHLKKLIELRKVDKEQADKLIIETLELIDSENKKAREKLAQDDFDDIATSLERLK